MRSLLFASVVLGFVLTLSLALASLAVWMGTTAPPLPGSQFFDPSAPDAALHDTYYVVAPAGQLTMVIEVALLHVIAAMFCATNAHALRGMLAAGWTFVAGATLAFVGQASIAVPAWLTARNAPQHYVDYVDMIETFQALAAMQTVSTFISSAGLAVMLLGWPLVGLAALRRSK